MTTVKAAAFFDLDKTVIATTSAMAFSRRFYANGLVTKSDGIRSAYAHFLFMVGGADADQTERLRARMSEMVTGWDVTRVREIVAASLESTINPVVYAEAVELIAEHHAAGRDVIIVSASPTELVEPIAAVLGADDAIASRMEVADGRFTGDIAFYAYGEHKAEAIRELAARRGYDLAASFAYSDSITDLPMLESVGHAFAVNPDRELREAADREGWGVLSFTRSVSLRAVLTSRPVLVAAAGLALLGALAFTWRRLAGAQSARRR